MSVLVPHEHRNLLGRESWRPVTLVIALVGPEKTMCVFMWKKKKKKPWKSHDFHLKSGLKG